MSWLKRSLDRLTGARPPVHVDARQEDARRRLEAVHLHGTHAALGAELAPRTIECATLDLAAFVATRDYRSATSNVLAVPDLVDGAVLLAVFEGNYKSGATALASSLVASALCDACIATTTPFDDARAEATLREAFAQGCSRLRDLEEAGPPDDVWDDFVREKVLDGRAHFRELGTSVTAALVVGDRVTLAHVGETQAYRVGADGSATRLTAKHLARILVATGADLEITRATLAPGDTLMLMTPSVGRKLSGSLVGATALSAANRCLEWAFSEPIPAAAIVAAQLQASA